MIVHHSHRIEDLVSALAGVVAEPVGLGQDEPFARETIAVQGRGMERWLSMELSRRLGVWANPDFPFPRRLVERAFDATLETSAGGSLRFEPEAMTWAIARLLPGFAGRREFDEPLRYVAVDPSPGRRIQLASRVAQTFDRYVLYRPEMISSWEGGAAPDDWQAILWRALVERAGPHHLAARAREFLARVAEGDGPIEGFPRRISLFGITTLPPRIVDVLAALAHRLDVHLFVLQPARAGDGARPLWESMGEVGRQFHEVLAPHLESGSGSSSRERVLDHGADCADAASGASTLLQAVQRVVRDGTPPGPPPDLGDGTIEVHACHGPMREVEVLRDRLRALFEADPTLEPRDVIVMTPDVERYAPLIEAAFDPPSSRAREPGSREAQEAPAIDYRVADRQVRATHPVVDALWALIDALSGRLGASSVVDLLLIDRIRQKFGFDEADLESLIAWIGDAGIRWGADPGHRAEVGQPPLRQNTWEEGFDRLMLALAMPAPEPGVAPPLFGGTRPAPGVDPGRTDLLARLVEFRDALFSFREAVTGARTLERWRVILSRLAERMIDTRTDGAQQQSRIREALHDLAARAKEAGFEEEIPLASVREELSGELSRGLESHRFLTGGVTFCELVPMRSVPFRVVAMLGMNEGAFPRARVPFGFDLVAKSPQPGDRTPRDDDRYLFLEALVSARDHFVVTYGARSLRDGAPLSPSVVVDELVDEALRLAGLAGGEDLRRGRQTLVVDHPLHAFSPRYFDGSDARLFSHSPVDCASAVALTRARGEQGRGGRPWVRAPLPLEETGFAAPPGAPVVLSELARFFEHPVRGFLQQRLGLYLRDEIHSIEDRETLHLDALGSWIHRDALLRAELSGLDPGEAAARVRADGGLPPGAIGDEVERVSRETVRRILEQVRGLRGGQALPPIAVDLEIGGVRLVGEIGDLYPGGRVELLHSKRVHPREIGFWIRHLALCCVAPEGVPLESHLVSRDGDDAEVALLEPCADPEPLLLDLLRLYEEGTRVPLPLLLRTSITYAKAGMKQEWDGRSLQTARKAWEESQFSWDREDAYLAQAYRDVDPLDPEAGLPGLGFAELARRVWQPYLSRVGPGR